MRLVTLDLFASLAVKDGVSPAEIEAELTEALVGLPSVASFEVDSLELQNAGDKAFCCDICGSPIKQTVHMNGVVESTIGLSTGMARDGDFVGDEEVQFLCSENADHTLSKGTIELLRSTLSMNLRD